MSFDDYIQQMRKIKNCSALYTCSCKRLRPVEDLFFCMGKTCQAFICGQCTQQVIDTYYCPSCLNSFFSSTAFQNKNKCQQCRKCPICFCTLGHVTLPNGEFIFRCEYCKWRSDEIGLKGESIKALFAQIRERDQRQEGELKFQELVKVYADKFKKARAYDRRSFHYDPDMQLDEEKDSEVQEEVSNTDGDLILASKRCEEAVMAKNKKLWRLPKEDVKNEFETIKDDETFNLDSVLNLDQRFADQSSLPGEVKNMWPFGENLQTKIGHRCPRCARFVLKPKAGATKVTYDISLLAMLLFPRISVTVGYGQLKKGTKSLVIISLKNPCQAPVRVSFKPLPKPEQLTGDGSASDEDSGDDDLSEKKKLTPEGPAIFYGEDEASAEVVLPKGEFKLEEYSPVKEQQALVAERKTESNEGGGVIAYTHLSKMGLNFFVTPKVNSGDVKFSFLVNVKPADGNPETAKFIPYDSFTFQATINLGSVEAESCSL